jgi:hypothetical protein
MGKRFMIPLIVIGAIVLSSAQTLFYTDFRTTPEGFKAASAAATAAGKDDTLVSNPEGATAPKDTIIDGCTLSANKSSTTNTVILISKGSQGFIAVGDTAGCTPGRLSLKNSGNFIKFPTVMGPCTITYYAAGSSNSTGKGIQALVNGISTPEAGISELLLDTMQATRKVVYSYPEADSVTFTLIAISSPYLYDVRIETGAAGVIFGERSVKTGKSVWTKDNLVINSQNAGIDFYSIAGKKIMRSSGPVINISGFPKGVYLARVAGSGEKIKIVR